MGLFDKFKKKNEGNQSEDNSGKLDLSNPAVKKMVEWIEHPMEFGKKPDTVRLLDERLLFWPSQKKEKCYLIEFTSGGNYYIGFTGPITWCFIGIDFKKLTFEQLYERYTGWFIAFFTLNSETYDKTLEGTNEEKIVKQLHKKGITNITVLQKAHLGGENYYEFLAEKAGEKIKVVGIENDLREHKTDYILPFFEYIGIVWNPLDI
ncbi:MAG: hypothetical protein ACXVPU_13945 [Bacteroidia bacterium]